MPAREPIASSITPTLFVGLVAATAVSAASFRYYSVAPHRQRAQTTGHQPHVLDGTTLALDAPPLPSGWREIPFPGDGKNLEGHSSFRHDDGRVTPRGVHPLFFERRVHPALSKHPDFGRAFNDVNHWHYAMLNDHARNDAFYAALERTIIPGESVVLDIGSGTSGILAMMAARFGARRVFTVESNAVVAAVAAETIARNHLSSRIEMFVCSSMELTVGGEGDPNGPCGLQLAERATVLVSEIISTFLTSEGLEAAVADARHRLCVPTAVVIPAEASLIAVVSEGWNRCDAGSRTVMPNVQYARDGSLFDAKLCSMASTTTYFPMSCACVRILKVIHSTELLDKTYVGSWRGLDLRAANALRATEDARVVDLATVGGDMRYLTDKVTVRTLDLDGRGRTSMRRIKSRTGRADEGSSGAASKHSNSHLQSFYLNVTATGVASFTCWWFSSVLVRESPNYRAIMLDSDPDMHRDNAARRHHWGQACTASNFRGDVRGDRNASKREPPPAHNRLRSRGGDASTHALDPELGPWSVSPGDGVVLTLALGGGTGGSGVVPYFNLSPSKRLSELLAESAAPLK